MGKFEIIGIAVLVMIMPLLIWATGGWRRRRLEALRGGASMLGLSYEGILNRLRFREQSGPSCFAARASWTS
jgi:hypothetical protein